MSGDRGPFGSGQDRRTAVDMTFFEGLSAGVDHEEDMAPRFVDVLVIGAGQAGISVSYFLKQKGIPHVVVERDRPFASWRRRWEGFHTNTPNWMNTLPMLPADTFPSGDPAAFASRDELLEYLERCLEAVDPPIEAGVSVQRVTQLDSGSWEVDAGDRRFEARSVVVCNGAMSTPYIPEAASETVGLAAQIHSSEYRAPTQIETRNVLIVGSASSGVQICRLLADSGRFEKISMAVSNVLTLPKRILGVPTHRFLHALRLFDVRSTSLLGRIMYSGLETKGDPIMRPAPTDLHRAHGVRLFGKFIGVENGDVAFEGGHALSPDDLTIVWCTGFRSDYRFIQVLEPQEVFSDSGAPKHVRGVIDAAPGLYFVGLRYQHTVASHDLYGVGADAEHVASHVSLHLASSSQAEAPAEARS